MHRTHDIVRALVSLLILAALARPLRAQQQPCAWSDGYGTLYTPAPALGIDRDGATLYIADGEAGLLVVNAHNVYNPYMLAQLDTPGLAKDVKYENGYAFIADGPSGLRIVDVSDPSHPMLVGAYDTPGDAAKLSVEGSLVAVADSEGGCLLIDASNPNSLGLLASIAIPGSTIDAVLRGDLLYTVSAEEGLNMYNILNPASPIQLGAFPREQATALALKNNHAFLMSSTHGIEELDVSDPSDIHLLNSTSTYTDGGDLQVLEEHIILARPHCFTEIRFLEDINTEASIFCWYYGQSTINQFELDLPYAYVTMSDRLKIIRLRLNNIILSETITDNYAFGVSSENDIAAVGNGEAGLLLLDISDPTEPEALGSVPALDTVHETAIAGDTVFAADNAQGFMVVDISDPANPTLLSRIPAQSKARSIALDGNLAYLTDNLTGLHIYDWSDPLNPAELGSVDTPGWALDIALRDHFAYIASRGAGLQIIDVSDPTDPRIVGTYDTPGNANKVTLMGDDLALIADGQEGLQIIEINDPTNPYLVSTYDYAALYDPEFPETTLAITTHGSTAYIGMEEHLMRLVDLSDPTAPRPIFGSAYLSNPAQDIFTHQDIVFLAGGEVDILDAHTDCEDRCPADLNADGSLDFFDISTMISAYQSNHPAADFNGDGSINFFDVSEFIVRYQRGCSFEI